MPASEYLQRQLRQIIQVGPQDEYSFKSFCAQPLISKIKDIKQFAKLNPHLVFRDFTMSTEISKYPIHKEWLIKIVDAQKTPSKIPDERTFVTYPEIKSGVNKEAQGVYMHIDNNVLIIAVGAVSPKLLESTIYYVVGENKLGDVTGRNKQGDISITFESKDKLKGFMFELGELAKTKLPQDVAENLNLIVGSVGDRWEYKRFNAEHLAEVVGQPEVRKPDEVPVELKGEADKKPVANFREIVRDNSNKSTQLTLW